MSKYSYEEKLEAVLRVIEEGMSYEISAKVLGTAQSHVQRWVKRYDNYGPEGLLLHNGTYTGEFKQHVIQYMHTCSIKCEIRRHKYRSYKGSVGKVSPNILNRKFVATKTNQKWITDVTEFNVRGEKVYLSPILDLFNGEIVSYNISLHPVFHQVMDMLEKAFEKIPNTSETILHSDQCWQY